MLDIRRATFDDAAKLAEIAERTFRATFASTNTDADMDLHSRANYSEAIQAGEIESPLMLTLLCEENGALIGFAQLRWEETPPCVQANSAGEVHRFYVVSDFHGRGIAQALMPACLAELQSRGSDVVWLGVWEHNPRAISFYRKFGFAEVGEHIYTVGSDPQRDLIMSRQVRLPAIL